MIFVHNVKPLLIFAFYLTFTSKNDVRSTKKQLQINRN